MFHHDPTSTHWLDLPTEHVGFIGNLCIVIPYGSPSAASLDRTLAKIEELAATGSAPALLLVMASRTGLPGDDARPALQSAFVRFRAIVAATAVVAMGEGFMAAAQRAVVAALFSFANMRNHRVHAEVSAAMEWLEPWLDLPIPASQIAHEVQALALKTRAG